MADARSVAAEGQKRNRVRDPLATLERGGKEKCRAVRDAARPTSAGLATRRLRSAIREQRTELDLEVIHEETSDQPAAVAETLRLDAA